MTVETLARLGRGAGRFLWTHRNGAVFVGILIYVLGIVPEFDGYHSRGSGHAYQLLFAVQLLHGKVPSVDVVTAAGPLQAVLSAPGLALMPESVVFETVLCAVAWSLALYLLFRLVQRGSRDETARGFVAGLLAVYAGVLLIGMFYKWFYWLVPLSVGALLCSAFEREDWPENASLKHFIGAALIAAVTGLYRPELGFAMLVACVVLLGLFAIDRRAIGKSVRIGLLIVGIFAAVVATWPLMVVLLGGSVEEMIASFTDGVSGVMNMRRPVPIFDFRHPISPESGLALMAMLTFAVYPPIIVAAVVHAFSRSRRIGPRLTYLVVLATLGLGIGPQFYRLDVLHYQQICAPFLATAGILPFALAHVRGGTNWRVGSVAAVVIVVLIAAGIAGIFERRYMRKREYESFGDDIVERYTMLHQGPKLYLELTERDRENEFLELKLGLMRTVVEAQRLTEPDEPILILFALPGAHYINRELSGVFIQYYDGVYEGARWLERDLAAIRANPPALVLRMKAEHGGDLDRVMRYTEFLEQNYVLLEDPDLADLPVEFLVPRPGGPATRTGTDG